MTKEEFGVYLYHAISLFAGRDQVRHYLQLKPAKKRRSELLTRERELTDQITVLMPKLSPSDQRRLLDRYESQGAA